jgi:hypothetical protein
MRVVILACLMLAGCGLSPDYTQWSAEQLAAHRAPAAAATKQREQYAASPSGQADLGCRAKTQFAMAGWRQRSILDLEGAARANQMHASCMDYWRQTGRLP